MTQQLHIIDGVLQPHPLVAALGTMGWSPSTEMVTEREWKRVCQKADALIAEDPARKEAIMRELGLKQRSAFEVPRSELVESIRKNGLRNKIVIYEGCILDGIARVTACKRAGFVLDPDVHFDYKDFPSWFAAAEFVKDQNVVRRHLTLLESFEYNRKLNAAVGRQGLGGRPKTSAIAEVSGARTLTRPERAQLTGLSIGTVERLDAVDERGVPALGDMVVRGEVKPGPAELVARLPEAEQRQVVAKGPEAVRQRAAAMRAEPTPRVSASVDKAPVETAAQARKAEARTMDQLGNSAHQLGLVMAHFTDHEPSTPEVRRRAHSLFARIREQADAGLALLGELDEDALTRLAGGEPG